MYDYSNYLNIIFSCVHSYMSVVCVCMWVVCVHVQASEDHFSKVIDTWRVNQSAAECNALWYPSPDANGLYKKLAHGCISLSRQLQTSTHIIYIMNAPLFTFNYHDLMHAHTHAHTHTHMQAHSSKEYTHTYMICKCKWSRRLSHSCVHI